eukprot:CAMPEP_0119041502 /NCGR_PEP_ID=MMETSP1177-20130426/12441_1 /TAXON_ID=2985 /ORGANISM="Ochromonas sp, Strain CCMP1899" /LENGTH=147 /DNA_ID=CAMNT_0007007591 /DNA_START=136 /DNA_END=576 /DNA_ORIENTATION=+
MSWADTQFGEQLVTKAGVSSTSEALKGKKFIGVYFSAHWCPPCRKFTPELTEFYEQLKEEDEDALEIVFASADNDQESWDGYYGGMPWVGIPFDKLKYVQELSSKYEVQGYPTFVILKAEDGSVVDAEGREAVSAAKGNTSKCLSKW